MKQSKLCSAPKHLCEKVSSSIPSSVHQSVSGPNTFSLTGKEVFWRILCIQRFLDVAFGTNIAVGKFAIVFHLLSSAEAKTGKAKKVKSGQRWNLDVTHSRDFICEWAKFLGATGREAGSERRLRDDRWFIKNSWVQNEKVSGRSEIWWVKTL